MDYGCKVRFAAVMNARVVVMSLQDALWPVPYLCVPTDGSLLLSDLIYLL